jgi:alkylation response protein AidB-like acyl-CoA dehydrogenase
MLGENPDVVFSGAINPLGRAKRVEGGYVVSGRWPFASGCEGADYFWGGCLLTDRQGDFLRDGEGQRQARQVVVARADYDVDRTWLAPG